MVLFALDGMLEGVVMGWGVSVNESSHLVTRYLRLLIYTIHKVFTDLRRGGETQVMGVDGGMGPN